MPGRAAGRSTTTPLRSPMSRGVSARPPSASAPHRVASARRRRSAGRPPPSVRAAAVAVVAASSSSSTVSSRMRMRARLLLHQHLGRRRAAAVGEAVAPARHGLDVAAAVAAVAQRLAQQRDVLREVVLFDEGVGPEPADDLVLLDDVPAALDEEEEGVEGLGRERDGLAGAEQAALRHLQTKRAEFVKKPGLLAHLQPSAGPSEKIQRALRTFGGAGRRVCAFARARPRLVCGSAPPRRAY